MGEEYSRDESTMVLGMFVLMREKYFFLWFKKYFLVKNIEYYRLKISGHL